MEKLEQRAQTSLDTLLTSAQLPETPNDALVSSLFQAFYYSEFLQKVASQYPQAFVNAISSLHVQSQQNSEELALNYKQQLANLRVNIDIQGNTLIASEKSIASIVRQFRHIKMAEIAYLDFLQLQSIEDSMRKVSELADAIICFTYDCLYEALCKRYGQPEKEQDLLIIGMGKLGGFELNFSSDIDLIFTYPNTGYTNASKPLEHQVFFTRLAQKFIQALDQITQDGRAYIVDMRLRPLGESGPLVLPFSAFETYYQEQGREWERFAMQKMRIINETQYNSSLYEIIRPFVYRKYIDFTTIESIREMKQLIEKEVRRRQIDNNIKLGKGGIREVEFFIQSIQLIHAGRHQHCQLSSILASMDAIEHLGLQGKVDMQGLRKDYLFLRKIEHYLQAFKDEQTQTLPIDEAGQMRLSKLLNHKNFSQTQSVIKEVMQRINAVFSNIINDANEQDTSENESEKDKVADALGNALEDLWTLDLNEEEAEQTLNSFTSTQIPFDKNQLIQLISKFKKKTARAGISTRAVKSINKLMPLLLQDICEQDKHIHQDQYSDGLAGVFEILQTVCGRVTYVDLLLEHPEVRQRLLFLCRKSPWIAQQIAHYPILLDELLYPQYLDTSQNDLDAFETECKDQLRQAFLRVDTNDEELVLERLREFKHTYQLRIAAADISGTLAINKVSDKLTILAQVIIDQVINIAWQQMTNLYGHPFASNSTDAMTINSSNADNKHLAIIAYGKFGGLELSYGSDLDIIFLHGADLSGQTDNSGKRKQISVQEFFIKLVQRFSSICTTKSYSGVLYDIDLRLRPSGNSGLLISHIDSFLDYQLTDAWTWEHQALVRSRAIYGTRELINKFKQIRLRVLSQKRNQDTLKKEVSDMRNKMRDHLYKANKEQIDIKQAKGGVVDIEFLVQYWVLLHANVNPEIVEYSDNLRLIENLVKSTIIDEALGQTLCNAYLLLRHAAHRVQLANKQYARGGKNQSMELKQAMQTVAKIYDTYMLDEI